MYENKLRKHYFGLGLDDLLKYGAVSATFLIVIGLLFSKTFALLAALLIAHAAMSFAFRKFKKYKIGIETVMLITILSALAYGAKTGAIIGAIAMFMDYIFSMRFSYFVLVTTTTYALIGYAAAFFAEYSITTVGVVMVVVYNIITSFIIISFMGGHIDKCARFAITNLLWNIALFWSVAPAMLKIMA